jgi:chemotaxis protein MotB
MVSYADFITLLFAFFVVMYAVSSVNEGKYRVLSESLSKAFSISAQTLEPIQIGDIKRSGDPKSIEFIKRPVVIDRSDTPAPVPKPRTGEVRDAGDKPLKVLFDGLRAAVAEITDKGLIKVNTNEFGVEIEISTSILFNSGEAILSENAKPVMRKLAAVLMPFPHEVNVQGYTDNIPIQSAIYPSNWQLSAARAASVVQLFSQLGMQPERLSATGFGEYRPASDNETDEGRQANRRVVIFVPVLKDKARVMDAINQLGASLNRGITFDQPASPELSEGIRRNARGTTPGIIQSPASENRFFNATTPDLSPDSAIQALPSTQPVIDTRLPDTPRAIQVIDGNRHIGRQPIEGQRTPAVPAEEASR